MIFVSTSFAKTSGATSVSPAKPTGTQDKDYMLAQIYAENGLQTAASGWTQLGYDGTGTHFLYCRVANSESGPYQWIQYSSGKMRTQISTLRGGFDYTDPVDDVSNSDYTTSDTIMRAASFSVAKSGSPIIFVGTALSATSKTFTAPTVPTSFSKEVDGGDTDSDSWMTLAHCVWNYKGATQNIDGAVSASLSLKHSFAVALNPRSGNGLFF